MIFPRVINGFSIREFAECAAWVSSMLYLCAVELIGLFGVENMVVFGDSLGVQKFSKQIFEYSKSNLVVFGVGLKV